MCGGTWEYRTRDACQRRWRANTVAPIRVRAGEGPMPVDNQMYDRLSHTRWEDDGFLNVLKSALNRSRFGYLRSAMSTAHGSLCASAGEGAGLGRRERRYVPASESFVFPRAALNGD